MSLLNLTPHEVTILGGEPPYQESLVLAPSGQVARVATESRQVGTVAGLPVFAQVFGEVIGLPEPREGVALLVSAMVRLASAAERAAQGMAPREDVLSPGELVRDSAGKPVGCKGLVVS